MKKLILLLLSVITISCKEHKADPNKHYINDNCVIVSTSTDEYVTHGKGRHITTCRIWLIKRLADTTQYTELNSCTNISSCCGPEVGINMTDSIFYNKKIGDTLYFKYIAKDRFWTKH
jgi:hypothetical protein